MPMPGTGLVLRYDGRAWSPAPIPAAPFLLGVHAPSATDMVAAGVNLTILRFDGEKWQLTSAGVPPPAGTPGILTRVWSGGPHHAYAAGFGGLLIRFDGRTWAPIQTATTESLGAVFGFPSGEVFVVGGGGTILRQEAR
jgi:hypothetical protein